MSETLPHCASATLVTSNALLIINSKIAVEQNVATERRQARFAKRRFIPFTDPESNIIDHGYSESPGQHKCGHVIVRDDGNFAVQPNNRVLLFEPSFTTKYGKMVIDRLINERQWDVEDSPKWTLEDSNRYHYDVGLGEQK